MSFIKALALELYDVLACSTFNIVTHVGVLSHLLDHKKWTWISCLICFWRQTLSKGITSILCFKLNIFLHIIITFSLHNNPVRKTGPQLLSPFHGWGNRLMRLNPGLLKVTIMDLWLIIRPSSGSTYLWSALKLQPCLWIQDRVRMVD